MLYFDLFFLFHSPQFVTVYFDQPDSSGHKAGPDSALVNSSLGDVDKVIGRLWAGLEARNISDCVNMIITSDHGMSRFNKSYYVDVNDVSES